MAHDAGVSANSNGENGENGDRAIKAQIRDFGKVIFQSSRVISPVPAQLSDWSDLSDWSENRVTRSSRTLRASPESLTDYGPVCHFCS